MDAAGMVMLAVGLLLLVFAPMIGASFRRRWRTWPRTVATVTRVTDKTRTEQGREVTDTWIRYRFTDADGHPRTSSDTVFRRPKKGSEFTVRYDPANPEDSNSTAGDRPLLVMLLGVLPVSGLVLVVWGFLRVYGG